jgi:hypothetical protein
MRLDAKVHGTLIKNKDGREIPEDEFIVFRPADNACLPMLEFYYQMLMEQKAGKLQLAAVSDLIARVRAWRLHHPERCKVADVEPGELSQGM